MKKKNLWFIVLFVCVCIGFAGRASAITFPDPTISISGIDTALPYGDFYSYTLPLTNYLVTGVYQEKLNSGDMYYVPASPGSIANQITIYQHSPGHKDNASGMDDSYLTPTGSLSYKFSTVDEPDPDPQPGDVDYFVGDVADTWDIKLDTLISYLDGSDLLFFFEHNQLAAKGGLDLYGWGQVSIVDAVGATNLTTKYYDFTNNNSGVYSYQNTTGAGPVNDVIYDGTGNLTSTGDYVYSPGVLDLGGGLKFVHNKGTNSADFAFFSPEINDGLADWLSAGYDTLQVQMRLAELNDGAEQLFIKKGFYVAVIPEPTTILLLGSGLLGLAGAGFRRKKS